MASLIALLIVVAESSEPAGQIAYLSGSEQEDRCVVLLDVATGATTRLGPGNRDGRPIWSPDGAWLAFESRAADGMGVFIVKADGSELRPVPHAREWSRYPVWAPLPETGPYRPRLAYSSSDGNPREETICVYDPETGTEHVWAGGHPGLTRPVWLGPSKLVAVLQAELAQREDDEATVWASVEPDPKNTLLAVGLTGSLGALSTAIFVVMPDQALPLPSYTMPSRGSYVEWAVEPSPDGKAVAFESNDGGDREVFVMTDKGASDVSNHRAADWNPIWSPDGNWLAFESFRDGRRGVYRVNPDTGLVIPVAVSNAGDCWSPTWSPDSRWLAFVSNITGNPDIFISDRNGESVRCLTDFEGEDLAPAWRPRNAP